MIVINNKKRNISKNLKKRHVKGRSLLNTLIDNLGVELHIPGYQFCGPGTKLADRLAKNQEGINPLDAACKIHDIAYSESSDLTKRHEADKILQQKAKERIESENSTFKERLAARAVNFAMAAKRKIGSGMNFKKKQKNKKITFENNVKKIRSEIRLRKPKTQQEAIHIALKAAHRHFTSAPKTRIIPLPKTGGIIPFVIPVLAALASLTGVGSGIAGIVRTINEIKDGKKKLMESERHNKAMEHIALKTGSGVYLRPYKNGFGLSFTSKSKK